MFRYILIAVVLLGGYTAHTRYVFSNDHVEEWLTKIDKMHYTNDPELCDAFAKDIEVSIYGKTNTKKPIEFSGKEDMCNFSLINATANAVMLHGGLQIESNIEDLKVVKSKFPWTQATVTYTQTINSSLPGSFKLKQKSEDSLIIARTIHGLRIKSIDSEITERRVSPN